MSDNKACATSKRERGDRGGSDRGSVENKYISSLHTNQKLGCYNNMTFKAKLRQIGNSIGVIIPLKVITNYELGGEIELNVITKEEKEVITPNVITEKQEDVITPEKPFNTELCEKHEGVMKGSCGCEE